MKVDELRQALHQAAAAQAPGSPQARLEVARRVRWQRMRVGAVATAAALVMVLAAAALLPIGSQPSPVVVAGPSPTASGPTASGPTVPPPRARVITTYVGIGDHPGFSGDGGPAARSEVNGPRGLAADQAGNLYIADTRNNRVRKVSPSGVITTAAGIGEAGLSGDGGLAVKAQLDSPQGVGVGLVDTLYIADSGNDRVRSVSKETGEISSVPTRKGDLDAPTGVAVDPRPQPLIWVADAQGVRAVPLDGPARPVISGTATAVAVDRDGGLLLPDAEGNVVRKLARDAAATPTVVAGTGVAGFSGDGGPATKGELNSPTSVTVDQQGNIYIADLQNNRVRKVAPDGTITTVAGNGHRGIAGDGGPPEQAELDSPIAVTVDPDGNLYIADVARHVIRKVSAG